MNDFLCTRCGDEKPPTAFPLNASKARGRDSECLRCKRLRENTPAARLAKRVRFIRRKYGLSPEQYDGLVGAFDNRCGICRRPERRTNECGERMPLAVDHCHATNVVRGLLCGACNKGIGLLGDDAKQLLAAYTYLLGGRSFIRGNVR